MDNNVLNATQQALVDLWGTVIGALPEIIAALLVFILGLIIAPIFGSLARKLMNVARVDTLAEKTGVKAMFDRVDLRFSFARLVGKLVKWFIIIAFLIASTDILGWDRVTEFLNEILLYLPNVIIAVIILAAGLILADFVKKAVVKGLHASKAPINHPEMLGRVAKWATAIFAGLAALLQLGIAPSLIQILFTGFVLALALAFGLGGQEKARQLLRSLDKNERSGGME